MSSITKFLTIWTVIAVIFFAACKKENQPKPSPDVVDPYARVDNPNNSLDHQIFLFYQQSGLPILYSDTVAKSPLLLLNLGYHLTSSDPTIFAKFSKNQIDILYGVNYFITQVYPLLGTQLRPYSVLLADSLYTITNSRNYPFGPVKTNLASYIGLTTLAVGKVSQIRTMNSDSLKAFKKNIIKPIILNALGQRPELLKDFQTVSASYYGKYTFGTSVTDFYVPFAAPEVYGIISAGGVPPISDYTVPDSGTDLDQFLDALLLLTPAEFNAKYNSYPLVMSKYPLLVKAITTLGYKY